MQLMYSCTELAHTMAKRSMRQATQGEEICCPCSLMRSFGEGRAPWEGWCGSMDSKGCKLQQGKFWLPTKKEKTPIRVKSSGSGSPDRLWKQRLSRFSNLTRPDWATWAEGCTTRLPELSSNLNYSVLRFYLFGICVVNRNLSLAIWNDKLLLFNTESRSFQYIKSHSSHRQMLLFSSHFIKHAAVKWIFLTVIITK